MDLPPVDRNNRRPLVDQVVAHYRQAIEGGQLRPGEHLPPIRTIADRVGLTRTTVQDAYRQLQDLGLVSATVGRGTVVQGDARDRDVLSPGARAVYRHLVHLPHSRESGEELVCNFAELQPDEALFPVEEFTASLQRVLESRGPELLGYGQPTGDLQLRRLLAVMNSGAPSGDPDEVLVTNGAQQGIDLVLRTFARPGDGIAVAVPTYHHLFGLLEAHDLHLVPLRSSAEGLDLEDVQRVLARDDVRLLYLMPTFHNPTGRTMDIGARQELMRVVRASRVPVLEDEFELDLRFTGESLPSLRTMDTRGLTVTIRTFSKGLFPGVRIGWIHAGVEVLGPMAALKRYMDLETSPLLQAALVDFLRSGAVDRYLHELRSMMRRRHAVAQEALSQHMPSGFSWTKPDGGLALWVEGPVGFDGEVLARVAADRGVLVSPGRLFHPVDVVDPGLRLSLSRADESQIREGIRILGQCVSESPTGRPSHRPLIL